MDANKVFNFLAGIASNNNKAWFLEHKDEYLEVKQIFEDAIAKVILRISVFDSSVSHLAVKDVTYRFYRDVRFSEDKSPYKRHLGAYIAAHGKKSLHGGYYLHLEPNNCFLACGNYCLPTKILYACRNEIMANIDKWLSCVENHDFLRVFGAVGKSTAEAPKGFGLSYLKTCPTGFPSDYEYIRYLRMKDYCCWHHVNDDFFSREDWIDRTVEVFKIAKPMQDFINEVVDDYEYK